MFVKVAAYDTSNRIGDMAASMEEKPLEGAEPVKVLRRMLPLVPTRVPGTATGDTSLDLGVSSGFTDSSRQAGIPNPSVSFEGISQVDQVKSTGFPFYLPTLSAMWVQTTMCKQLTWPLLCTTRKEKS